MSKALTISIGTSSSSTVLNTTCVLYHACAEGVPPHVIYVKSDEPGDSDRPGRSCACRQGRSPWVTRALRSTSETRSADAVNRGRLTDSESGRRAGVLWAATSAL